MPILFLMRGFNTSRAVLVPGMTISSEGEISPIHPPPTVIRTLKSVGLLFFIQ